MKSISIEDAVDAANTIKDLAIKGVLKPIKFYKTRFFQHTQNNQQGRINILRRSFIAAAESSEAILVTEDEKLKKAANKFVKQ